MALGKNKPRDGEEKVRYYHAKYISYSRAIGVMWAVLVVCYLIITIVCLIQPTWLGADRNAAGEGYFGLWHYYKVDKETATMAQFGSFLDLDAIPSSSFRAATFMVGIAVLLSIICVLCLLLFFCLSSNVVFMACGWILAITALFMLLACIIYPGGWDADVVVEICQSASYDSGNCYIQWAYILAIIAIFDAIILAVLAFILAYRQVKLLPWQKQDKIKHADSKAYVIEDDGASGIRYMEPVRGPQPIVVVPADQRSIRSGQVVGTLRSQKSLKHAY